MVFRAGPGKATEDDRGCRQPWFTLSRWGWPPSVRMWSPVVQVIPGGAASARVV